MKIKMLAVGLTVFIISFKIDAGDFPRNVKEAEQYCLINQKVMSKIYNESRINKLAAQRVALNEDFKWLKNNRGDTAQREERIKKIKDAYSAVFFDDLPSLAHDLCCEAPFLPDTKNLCESLKIIIPSMLESSLRINAQIESTAHMMRKPNDIFK